MLSRKKNLRFKEPNCKNEKSEDQIHKMSLEQKKLRIKIKNTTDIDKIIELKQKRINILKNMTKRVNKIKQKQIASVLDKR